MSELEGAELPLALDRACVLVVREGRDQRAEQEEEQQLDHAVHARSIDPLALGAKVMDADRRGPSIGSPEVAAA